MRMLDIGTGANGIYPLLASSVYDWECVATDISKASLDNVAKVLKSNASILYMYRYMYGTCTGYRYLYQGISR